MSMRRSGSLSCFSAAINGAIIAAQSDGITSASLLSRSICSKTISIVQ